MKWGGMTFPLLSTALNTMKDAGHLLFVTGGTYEESLSITLVFWRLNTSSTNNFFRQKRCKRQVIEKQLASFSMNGLRMLLSLSECEDASCIVTSSQNPSPYCIRNGHFVEIHFFARSAVMDLQQWTFQGQGNFWYGFYHFYRSVNLPLDPLSHLKVRYNSFCSTWNIVSVSDNSRRQCPAWNNSAMIILWSTQQWQSYFSIFRQIRFLTSILRIELTANL